MINALDIFGDFKEGKFWWEYDPELNNWDCTVHETLSELDGEHDHDEGLHYFKGSGSMMCEWNGEKWITEYNTAKLQSWIKKYHKGE